MYIRFKSYLTVYNITSACIMISGRTFYNIMDIIIGIDI